MFNTKIENLPYTEIIPVCVDPEIQRLKQKIEQALVSEGFANQVKVTPIWVEEREQALGLSGTMPAGDYDRFSQLGGRLLSATEREKICMVRAIDAGIANIYWHL